MNRHMPAVRAALGLLILSCALCLADDPAWWTERSVLDTNATVNDYGAANQGQVKWIATNAYDEFQDKLSHLGGAGSTVSNMVIDFTETNNYLPVNLGQLKKTVEPYYDRLHDLTNSYPYITNAFPANMAGDYPWSATTADDNDHAIGNIGQLKQLFSFDLDRDADSLPDWWEVENGLDPTTSDTDGDGLGDYEEVEVYSTDATNYWDPGELTLQINIPEDGRVLP